MLTLAESQPPKFFEALEFVPTSQPHRIGVASARLTPSATMALKSAAACCTMRLHPTQGTHALRCQKLCDPDPNITRDLEAFWI